MTNSIEESEDGAVRGLLGTAFAAAEPPLRDLASGSIARGDAARRRNRLFAAGGAALSVVAVIGTFALVTGATPPGRAGNPNPADPVTSAATSQSPTGYLGFGPMMGSVAKTRDIKAQVPGLMQPLLPAGITVSSASSDSGYPVAEQLTGATGTNELTMWVGQAPSQTAEIRQTVCPAKVTCQTRDVDGGTVYFYEAAATAVDTVRDGGDYYPVDIVKPGTEKTVVTRSLSMTFVPADRTKYAFNVTLSTNTAQVQFADHAPSDYPKGATWPPTLPPNVSGHDSSGLLMSADDVVGMLGKPGLDKLEYLLDPRTPVSQGTETRITDTYSQIAAAAEAALPSGTKVSVSDTSLQPGMIITGPTGKNTLTWESESRSTLLQDIGWCPPNVTCMKTTVLGGTLEVWDERPMDSKGPVATTDVSAYHYWFLPDDASKPGLNMVLGTAAAQTGEPTRTVTPPGQTYSESDGPYAPAQVIADEFLAAVQNGRLATAIAKTTSLLATLR